MIIHPKSVRNIMSKHLMVRFSILALCAWFFWVLEFFSQKIYNHLTYLSVKFFLIERIYNNHVKVFGVLHKSNCCS